MSPNSEQLARIKSYQRLDQFMTRIEVQKKKYRCADVRQRLYNIFDKVKKDEQQGKV